MSKGEVQAAALVSASCDAIVARGSNIAQEVTGGAAELEEWRRYPEGEFYDPDSHGQYFYHHHGGGAGSPSPRSCEHGHFHIFLREEGMPAGVAPLLLPELAVADVALPPQAAPSKRGQRDGVCHLVAIAVDSKGAPLRLFTTNRWVTGETWYRAEDVVRMLDRFVIRGEQPSPELNAWISGMVALFRPQIAALLRMRDKTIMGWRRRRRVHVFEDPRLEITSSLDIDLAARLAEVRGRHRAPVTATAVPRRSRLPRMDEGWLEEGVAS